MISFHAFSDREEAAAMVFRWDFAQEQLGYKLTHNWDANHCEFYVDGTLGEHWYNQGYYQHTLKFYFYIDRESLIERQHGQILNLAAYVSEPEAECLVKAKDDIVSLCLAGRFAGDFVVHRDQEPPTEITGFAFFLDVKRADASIDRLWLKNGDCNFTIADIQNYRVGGRSLGRGNEFYVSETSPLFNQKKACQR